MIGRLTGVLAVKQPPWLLIDVGGVGYELQTPLSTFYRLPEVGATVTLQTHFVVREDAQLLYGFDSGVERSLFRALLKVSGVGPKVALAVLSGVTVDEFRAAVQAGDVTRLTRTPGIGKKTAERILVEMRDRLPDGAGGVHATVAAGIAQAPDIEARAALESLGYKAGEAQKLVSAVYQDGMATDAVIREALKHTLSRKA